MPQPQSQFDEPASRRAEDPAYPTRRSDIRLHQLDDEGLIHDTVSGNTHWLNSTALFIWQKCDGRLSPTEIAGLMVRAYDVSLESARNHVDRMIAELYARNLVHPATPSDDSA